MKKCFVVVWIKKETTIENKQKKWMEKYIFWCYHCSNCGSSTGNSKGGNSSLIQQHLTIGLQQAWIQPVVSTTLRSKDVKGINDVNEAISNNIVGNMYWLL